MGMGAYQSLQRLGIKVVVTDVADIEEAAKAYAQGTLENHLDRLH
jgi:predicted Fe-Mo cluster-binding NifX family protein